MTEPKLVQIWVYLSASPLLGLAMTLVVYSLAYRLYIRANSNPLLNPVVTSVAVLIGILLATNTTYDVYFDGAQFVHFLLGPATVALAVPLYQQFAKLKQVWLPVTVALMAGVLVGTFSSITIAKLLGASLETQLSLAPKSVTAPVAMGISEQIGGLHSLTAALVVVTGIIGAVIGTKLFDLMGVKDDSVKGIAMGLTAHGIGTARAFQVSDQMGAFSGLAMALSAFTYAIVLPWLLGLIGMID
ncbi:LrgB family protein [Marinobacter caseinilyticus]|uniref:LrgB family protein n=1 Tax=Marinobacter caseinilyticus TaxID=2692195 RepID=UPI00140BCFB6|nr:LrgB family protein [Marinobacter caseinilyticus]